MSVRRRVRTPLGPEEVLLRGRFRPAGAAAYMFWGGCGVAADLLFMAGWLPPAWFLLFAVPSSFFLFCIGQLMLYGYIVMEEGWNL